MMNSKELSKMYLTVLSEKSEAEAVIVALPYRVGKATQVRLYWGTRIAELIEEDHPAFTIGRDFVRWDAPMVTNSKKALRTEDEQDLAPYRFTMAIYYKDIPTGENGTRSAILERMVQIALEQAVKKDGILKGATVKYTGATCKAGVHDFELRTPDGHVYAVELKGWNGVLGWSTTHHKVAR